MIKTLCLSLTISGEADAEIQKRSGKKTYNVKLTTGFMDKEENTNKEEEKGEDSDLVRFLNCAIFL